MMPVSFSRPAREVTAQQQAEVDAAMQSIYTRARMRRYMQAEALPIVNSVRVLDGERARVIVQEAFEKFIGACTRMKTPNLYAEAFEAIQAYPTVVPAVCACGTSLHSINERALGRCASCIAKDLEHRG